MTTANTTPRLRPTIEVAAELGVDAVTLHKLIKLGLMPSPAKCGKAFLWSAADVENAKAAIERECPLIARRNRRAAEAASQSAK